ncbi:ATP-dependent helicase HrpB [Pseudaeromonas paramecii]|uniref:ATP-dependent helicase HrpB n=1 Tax=Pseudaeromonas paramecii TaxID=2138166 RepID=A0ABP8Q415_9GAMM
MPSLPIQSLLATVQQALQAGESLIIQAPPGAGKSTLLPLSLVQQSVLPGRILMLEPRRLAARNIAAYLAEQLGEPLGQRIGYRVRGESRVSPQTMLEIVTEGVLTRLLQDDPELNGVSLIIFDEFHERSLHADLGLSLALESRAALRPDLRLMILSATLEGLDFSRLLPEARQLDCPGRAYPIEYRYRPVNRLQPLIPQWGKVVLEAVAGESGSLLVFLPGAGEIDKLAQYLAPLLESNVRLCPLHGRLPLAQQRQAIAPAAAGERKLVLATNVAETSLTIEGISLVVDTGLERRARFDAAAGLTRLESRQVSQASATQRAGRAGRLGPGVAYRLWPQEQQDRLSRQAPPQIAQSELTDLVLEAACWGTSPEALPLLDAPPAQALAAARALLTQLEALDEAGRLTARGRQMASLPCHPRFAHMLLASRALEAAGLAGAQAAACQLAALWEEPRRGGDTLHGQLSREAGALSPLVRRWRQRLGCQSQGGESALALVAALAWPDRIARLRSGQRYQLAGGQSADLVEGHPLTGSPWLLASDLIAGERGIRIAVAEALELSQLEQYLPGLFTQQEGFAWDAQAGRVRAERQRRLGQIVVASTPLTDLSDEQKARCLLAGIRASGLACLPWSEESEQLVARLRCAARWLPEWTLADYSEAGLLARLETWLLPHLLGMSRLEQLKRLDLSAILRQSLPWPLPQQLDEELPSHFTAPTGSRLRIRYAADADPVLPVRIQEMFGQRVTPTVAQGRVPLLIELLSPAQRPLQLTRDLVAFWQGSYAEVKKEMKGRYPKHYWPDDPLEAMPTRFTKQRMMKENHGQP